MTLTVNPYAPPQEPRVRSGPPARPRQAPAPRRPLPPRTPLSDTRLVVLVAVVVLLVLSVWAVTQAVALGALSQDRAQNVLHSQLREQLAAQTAPTGTATVGQPVALLTIPTLGIEQVVVEGTATGDLQNGPGHRRDTVLPGQKGASVIYGKALTWGAPFRSITSLAVGDGVTVTTGQGEFVYRVQGIRRAGDPLPAASDAARLTLVTVDVHSLMPGGVVYVDTVLQGDPVNGSGRVSAVPDAEKVLGTDSSGLSLLAVALALLLATAAAMVAMRRRLPTAVLWTLGAPLLLMALWWAGTCAGRLLPNVF